ncbi:gfo/Idh/MocA family oxidoreductase [Nakamurella sp. YIM 132087]|uniref:Gfo/Idh/MocA family oxidoreductase n=1 Tax=Nakamurella alba TaxID=2665158 RepID=A0A7K1FF33_9ACTN|nr:Gfo/Idh/MocA family oxidoreductase [Nakamurella alba]MTD12725.1 gfo/Idh/MocA family oxidoreductase [Nakamurella alba]
MSDSLGVAVIGAGMAGRAHAAGYRSAPTLYDQVLPDIRLVAIADVNEGFATDAARRFGYQRAETSWQAVAEADDIDVVSVVVANHLHREVVEGLLAAGKHVLCEKPFAPTIAEAQSMVDAAAAAPNQATGVGFVYRRSPAISAVRELVTDGAIGAPVHFNGRYWCDYAADPLAPMSWRYKGGPGSGALADIGSHMIDSAEYLCGPIVAVSGARLHTHVTERALPLGQAVGHSGAALSDVVEPVENEDVVTFTLRFASGALGTLSASRVAVGHPNSYGFDLYGDGGTAGFDMDRPSEISFVDSSTVGRTHGRRQVLIGPDHPFISRGMAMDFPGVGYGQNDLFVFQSRAFLDQAAGVPSALPPVPSFEHGLRNMKVMAAVVASAAEGGREITID